MRSTAFHSAAMATKIINKLRLVEEIVYVALKGIKQQDRENMQPTNQVKITSGGNYTSYFQRASS